MNKNTWKSIVAVLAGILTGIILSLGADVVLHTARVFPPWGQPVSDALLLLATVYRTIFGVAGSYVAARLAPDRPMLHALVLGTLGFAVSLVGAAVTWNMGPAFGAHWYPVALVVLAMPTAWIGGKLYESQLRTRSAAEASTVGAKRSKTHPHERGAARFLVRGRANRHCAALQERWL